MCTPISTCDWIIRYSSGVSGPVFLSTAVVDADLADVVEQAHQVEVARADWPGCRVPRRVGRRSCATRSEWPEV